MGGCRIRALSVKRDVQSFSINKSRRTKRHFSVVVDVGGFDIICGLQCLSIGVERCAGRS